LSKKEHTGLDIVSKFGKQTGLDIFWKQGKCAGLDIMSKVELMSWHCLKHTWHTDFDIF
jgi:hypothetical protein